MIRSARDKLNGWLERGWLLPILVALGALTLCVVIIGGIFFFAHDRQKTRNIAQLSHKQLEAEVDARLRLRNQVVYLAYVICRSGGRSKADCRIISHGAVIPANLTLDSLETKVAQIGEAEVMKLFVGPNGTPITGTGGAPGLRGPPGPQGKQGTQGSRGVQGPPGPSGGPSGPAGPKGAAGPPGPQGPAGSRGAQGAQGAQGQQGERGAQGERGPAGPAGPAGPTGPQGAPGLVCPAGFTAQTRTINQPGGQIEMYGCFR